MNYKVFLLVLSFVSCACINAQETVKAGANFFAGPIYWQANGNGLQFAVLSDSPTGLSPKSSVKNLSFDWDFGFQIGLGYRIPHDLWNFSLEYTRLHTNAHGQANAHGDQAIFPTWSLPASPGLYAAKAHGHWRLHLGLLDFLLSKQWQATSYLVIAPCIGLRSAWIRQKYNLEYEGGTLFPDHEESVRMKNKFWGIGSILGAKISWKITRHFSFFAKPLASLLYGQFYVHQDEDRVADQVKLLGLHDIFHQAAWIGDLGVGLYWDHAYQGTLKRVVVEAGWDQLLLSNQNQLLRFMNSAAKGLLVSNQGNLGLQGFHLTARFEF